MTEHDKVRRDRALRCDLDDIKSLEDAVVGLQSTDDPSLVPLHDKLFARLQELQRRRKVMSEKTIPEQVEEVVNKPEHYVAFKHGYGVLLGFKDNKPVWSLKAEGLTGRELAPTFPGYAHLLKRAVENKVTENDWPDTGVQIRLVFPTANIEGQPAATLEDCADAGLPRWGGK